MKQYMFFTAIFILLGCPAYAHGIIKGRIVNSKNGEPLSNAVIILRENNTMLLSDESGAFEFKRLESGIYHLECSMLGFQSRSLELSVDENETRSVTIRMDEGFLQINQITVSPRKEVNYFNAIDFRLRPTQTTQDLLRLVPGLFIAQHAGGGKAEQIFIRGFDVDHGTDVAISVDGMPVNMVSQAHGQGYADLHFVIPETVEGMDFSKGTYDARTGNFNTAGAVRFQTLNYLKKNVVKFEAGSFNTYRGLAMLKLLDKTDSTNSRRQNAYVASEFVATKGYFVYPQNFDRLNIMGKYTADLNSSTSLSLSLSTFSSRWDASGQIPERAVRSGLISWYGAIDPTEGGNTSRSNANLTLVKTLNDGAVIRNQIYGINYKFKLYSNFTFFKDDTLNGDEIFQYEERNIFGYNGSYSKNYEILGLKASTIAGVGLRDDNIRDIGLAHTVKRIVLSDIKKGDIDETNANVFIDQSFYLSSRVTLNLGLRYDAFTFRYNDRLSDTLGKSRSLNVFSPKINLYYNLTQGTQVYLSAGKGFHSNDTRVAIMDSVRNRIPAAYGLDLGTNLKVGNRIIINAALWLLTMDTEYTYTGDDGTIGSEGRSRRYGLDLSARGQLNKWLFFDFDFNYCKSRLTDNSDETGYLPLAPKFSSIAGLSIRNLSGFNASLRYRYLGERPAAEDNSIIAKGYFIMDAVVNYTAERFQISLSAENLFNQKWKEAQFATESRLRGEGEPVTEIHFTPGIPLFVKAGITYLF